MFLSRVLFQSKGQLEQFYNLADPSQGTILNVARRRSRPLGALGAADAAAQQPAPGKEGHMGWLRPVLGLSQGTILVGTEPRERVSVRLERGGRSRGIQEPTREVPPGGAAEPPQESQQTVGA